MKGKSLKKLAGIMLAAALAVGSMGCGQGATQEESKESTTAAAGTESSASTQEAAEPKEPVTLQWYYRGNGVQKDTQAVENRVNELLKDYEGLEHVTIKMNPFISSDYANGVLLAQTSGTQIDILNTVGLKYVDEVNNGTFIALDEYLNSEEFADLKAALPEWLWKNIEVNRSVYVVPNYQRAANRMAFTYPTEYAEYIDTQSLQPLLKDGVRTVEQLEELADVWEQYVLAVREKTGVDTKYCDRLPYDYVKQHIGGYNDTLANGGFIMYSGETEVKNVFFTDTFKKACEIAAGWYEEGLIPGDILVRNRDDYIKKNMLKEEAIPLYFEQFAFDGSEIFTSDQFGFETTSIPVYENNFLLNNWGAGGNGVTASCKHPKEALKFIEALTTGTELGTEIYNTIVYGLEGVHYDKVDDTHITTREYDTSQAGADVSYAAHKWIMGNTFHAYLNQACKDSDVERDLEINNNPDNIESPFMGFRLDASSISSEIEQCNAVVKEYQDSLCWGVKGSGWEAYYDEFIQKLETAGCQKVIDEIQKQFDAWANTK